MKKQWNTPEVESIEINATMTDALEAGNDTGAWDVPGLGEGCSLSDMFGSQCS